MANGQQKNRYELGDTFVCTCGAERTLTGMYLAAHWDELMGFTCEKCGKSYDMRRGMIWPVRNRKDGGRNG